MKIYTVHRRRAGGEAPDASGPSPRSPRPRNWVHRLILGEPDAIVLVKDGMCWPATVFTILWAMWHRLWAFVIGLLASTAALAIFIDSLDPDPLRDAVLTATYLALVGTFANDARRRSLAARGYEDAGIVMGENAEGAALRYLTSDQAGVGAAPP